MIKGNKSPLFLILLSLSLLLLFSGDVVFVVAAVFVRVVVVLAAVPVVFLCVFF